MIKVLVFQNEDIITDSMENNDNTGNMPDFA